MARTVGVVFGLSILFTITGNEGERLIVREVLALVLGAAQADYEPHLRVAHW